MSTEDILNHHLQSIGAGDVDAILSDFTDDSVLYGPDGGMRGLDEMRPFFEALVTDLLPPGSVFEMKQQIVDGDIAYIAWSGSSEKFDFPIGTDTFVIRDGKIAIQTFAAQVNPK